MIGDGDATTRRRRRRRRRSEIFEFRRPSPGDGMVLFFHSHPAVCDGIFRHFAALLPTHEVFLDFLSTTFSLFDSVGRGPRTAAAAAAASHATVMATVPPGFRHSTPPAPQQLRQDSTPPSKNQRKHLKLKTVGVGVARSTTQEACDQVKLVPSTADRGFLLPPPGLELVL